MPLLKLRFTPSTVRYYYWEGKSAANFIENDLI